MSGTTALLTMNDVREHSFVKFRSVSVFVLHQRKTERGEIHILSHLKQQRWHQRELQTRLALEESVKHSARVVLYVTVVLCDGTAGKKQTPLFNRKAISEPLAARVTSKHNGRADGTVPRMIIKTNRSCAKDYDCTWKPPGVKTHQPRPRWLTGC